MARSPITRNPATAVVAQNSKPVKNKWLNHDVPHIRRIGEEAKARKHQKSKPRRWVVECTLGWLSNCRALLVRDDKNGFHPLGLIPLACA